MIDLAFVESLIRALDESSLDSLELERGGTRIRLSKSAPGWGSGERQAATPASGGGGEGGAYPSAPLVSAPVGPEGGAVEAVAHDYIEVTSPMVGTFYRSPAPEAPPYAEVGTRIGKGSVLCIIEAMKLMNELESDVEGTIVKILVENAEPVEYGQLLFLIDPA